MRNHAVKYAIACFAILGIADQSPLEGSRFADSIIDYDPGSGFATDFETGEGFTNTVTALGPPARENPGQFGGPATPFSPPFQKEQLLSVGEGGTLTVSFDTPITDDPSHAFGMDFIIFGNSGFTITNGNFSGGGITDGSLFGANSGETRISVSSDNDTYYELEPDLAPTVDSYYPTDGSGNFLRPVNPALGREDFAGKGLPGIRELYDGSGGGTPFDLAWARNENGQPVPLDQVQYIRVDVPAGASEIDAFAAVPEPSSLLLGVLASGFILGIAAARGRRIKRMHGVVGVAAMALALSHTHAAQFKESFSEDPETHGWEITGTESLFDWNAQNEWLEVTWDSEEPNSFFYKPIPQSLTRASDFSLSFQIELSDITVDFEEARSYAFEIAVGWVNIDQAPRADFQRGSGADSPNLVEWDYFPDTGFGATVSPAIVSDESMFVTTFNRHTLVPGERYHVRMDYIASRQTLETTMTRQGEPLEPLANPSISSDSGFTDFKVNAVAVSSYKDHDPSGSLNVTGIIDDIELELPDPSLGTLRGEWAGGTWQTRFPAAPGWAYFLERSTDLQHWTKVGSRKQAAEATLTLTDPAPPQRHAFYRVRAAIPEDR